MTRNSGRNTDGTFAPGNPGKPKGSRHRATQAVERLLEGSSEAITRTALDLALGGDTTALRLCLERIIPPRKDAPVEFDLPVVNNTKDAAEAAQSVLQATSSGKLTPTEAAVIMTLVERYGRILELSEFEGRIDALERAAEATQ